MLHAPTRVLKHAPDSPFSKPQLDILYAAGRYYNGTPFYRDGQNHRLGQTQLPDIQTLLDAPDDRWSETYADALDDLVDTGLLRGSDDPEYIRGRPVKWTPTRSGRGAIGDLFFDEFSERYPDRVFHYHSGLVGDWDESLTHREGVEIAYSFQSKAAEAKLQDDNSEVTPPLVRYPGEHGGGHARPDIHSLVPEGEAGWDFAVEVITDHNDRESLVSKYQWFTQRYDNVWWVFDKRKTAVRSLSYLHTSSETDVRLVNAPYSNPENYSLGKISSYLRRSHENDDYSCPGVANIETIQSLATHLASLFSPAQEPF